MAVGGAGGNSRGVSGCARTTPLPKKIDNTVLAEACWYNGDDFCDGHPMNEKSLKTTPMNKLPIDCSTIMTAAERTPVGLVFRPPRGSWVRCSSKPPCIEKPLFRFGDNFDSKEIRTWSSATKQQTTARESIISLLNKTSLSLSRTHAHARTLSFYCSTTLQLPLKFVIVVDQV